MAENVNVLSLAQRLKQRRQALEAGDPTGGRQGAEAAAQAAGGAPQRQATPRPQGAAGGVSSTGRQGRSRSGSLSDEERRARAAAARAFMQEQGL